MLKEIIEQVKLRQISRDEALRGLAEAPMRWIRDPDRPQQQKVVRELVVISRDEALRGVAGDPMRWMRDPARLQPQKVVKEIEGYGIETGKVY